MIRSPSGDHTPLHPWSSVDNALFVSGRETVAELHRQGNGPIAPDRPAFQYFTEVSSLDQLHHREPAVAILSNSA